jgi:hypothetical protein
MYLIFIITAVIIGIPTITTIISKYGLYKERIYYKSGDKINVNENSGTLIRWDNKYFGYIRDGETEITFLKWSEFKENYTYHDKLRHKKHVAKMESTKEFMKANNIYMKPLNRVEKIDNIVDTSS